ncbi:hypothetical protein [Parasutterella muris]|uniref:Uncharacterized protein n=1 Tax=Parasutterella muris TaxID=2565572 RepID=A0A6L6YJ11_9BURK|nr:hypothetical protein [Parasutterella muris]MVX56852.1 hypothetical protein [Parasutterella muris]
MKSNKKLLDFYTKLYGLTRYASLCRFSYDRIEDNDGVNDTIIIGVGQLVIQVDCYLIKPERGKDYVIAVMNIDAVEEEMQDYPDNYNIWEHFQSIFCGADNEIKIMFDLSSNMHRRLYNELIKTILEPSV